MDHFELRSCCTFSIAQIFPKYTNCTCMKLGFVHIVHWSNRWSSSKLTLQSVCVAAYNCTVLRYFWVIFNLLHRLFDWKTHSRWVSKFIIIVSFGFCNTIASPFFRTDGHGRQYPFLLVLQHSYSSYVDFSYWKIIQIQKSVTFGHPIQPGSFF